MKPRCKKSGHKMKKSHGFCPKCGSMPAPIIAKAENENQNGETRTEDGMKKRVICAKAECGEQYKKKLGKCPKCGTDAPKAEEKPTLVKCACGSEEQAAARFCTKCGTPMPEAAKEEYTGALKALRRLAKAGEALPEHIEVRPESQVGAELFAKSESGIDVDPSELITEFARGHNTILDEERAGNGELRAVRKEVAEMAKAVRSALRAMPAVLVGIIQEQLGADIRKVLDTSPGPKARQAGVQLYHKAIPAGGDQEEKDESVRGPLLVKAVLAAELGGNSHLRPGDATKVESLAQGGLGSNGRPHTLQMICKAEDPQMRALGLRVAMALKETIKPPDKEVSH